MRYSGLIILIIAAVGVGWFYAWPAWGEVSELEATIDQYDDALDKVEEFQTLRDQHIENYTSFPNQDIQRIKEMLPGDFDQLWIFMNLDAVAGEHGIDISNLEVEEVGEDEEEGSSSNFTPHIIQFSFSANYNTLITFLEDLESRLRLLDIVELSFDARDDQNSEYDYDIVLYTYSLSGSNN